MTTASTTAKQDFALAAKLIGERELLRNTLAALTDSLETQLGAALESTLRLFDWTFVIEFVAEEFNPNDVFTDSALYDWAQEQMPGDVCTPAALDAWARMHGWVKAGEEATR